MFPQYSCPPREFFTLRRLWSYLFWCYKRLVEFLHIQKKKNSEIPSWFNRYLMYTQQSEQRRKASTRRWWWNDLDEECIRGTVHRYSVTGNSVLVNTVKFTANTSPKSTLVCRILIIKAWELNWNPGILEEALPPAAQLRIKNSSGF